MSDVTVAAPSGGAPAPAQEVPVQVDQTHAPNPVGSQAPETPTGRNPKDAISKAFERANNPKAKDTRHDQRPAPKAAEARPGHNQPPEDQKLDLRKRPTGDVPKGPQTRERAEHGHFAPAQKVQNAVQTSANSSANLRTPDGQYIQYRPEHNRLPPQARFRDPPNRFGNIGKHEWQHAPESVRAEVNRMYDEFGKAYKVYKADFDEMQTLRPFQKLAKACGTTMAKALSSYVSLEDKIRKNPLSGLDTVVQNLGLKTAEGQPITLRDIAYYIATLTPEQYAAVQRSNAEIATGRQIAAARNEIAQLKQSWQQAQAQQQFHYTRSAVDNYANSHPRLDELGDLIEQEIKHGYDLDTAYRRANLLRPASTAPQTRNTPAQTRPQSQDKSISGVPGSSNGARPKGKPSPTARAAVTNAISRMQGRA